MAQLVERIFTYVPAKAISIGGEQWSRKIALGNQWSRIRMGFLGLIRGNVTTQAYLSMGMSNGQLGGGTAIGNNAIGASLSGSLSTGSNSWTYVANSGLPYYGSQGAGKVFRRYPRYPNPFGPSLIAETSSSISAVNLPAAPVDQQAFPTYALRRAPAYFDITREVGGGGNATVVVYGCTTAHMAFDFRPDHFMDGLDQVGTPTLLGTAMTVLINTTIPVSDMLGALDTFFITWSRAVTPLEIYSLGASVVRPLYWDETANGGAADVFSNYATTGTATATVLTQGSGFFAQGAFSGTYTNPGVISGWSGTCGFPNDTFDQYSSGSIVSGVTVNAGTGWADPGVI